MADVFMSYAREDAAAAGRVARSLDAQGLSVFWDRDIPLGSTWDRVLERELKTAKCVVVLWSRASADSDWVRLEATDAADRGLLLPVFLEPVTLPLRFRLLQTTDLAGWSPDAEDARLAPLLAAVRERVHGDGAGRATAATTGIGADPPLRSSAATVSGKAVTAMVIGHGFHDRHANAAGRGVAHDYRPLVVGEDVLLHDRATGLMWQHGGSERPMVFADTDAYLHGLNAAAFAGFSDWRLPTLEEAGSLVEPEAHAEFHVSPAFQRGVNFIWTADRHPDGGVWVVYFHDALLSCASPRFNAWVRAVRSAP